MEIFAGSSVGTRFMGRERGYTVVPSNRRLIGRQPQGLLVQLKNIQAIDNKIKNIHFVSLVHEAKHTL